MRIALASAMLVLVLTGCGTTVGPLQTLTIDKTTLTVAGLDGFNRQAVQMFDPNGPNVWVTNNTITIDQEPVRPVASQGRVTIVWRLDASGDSTYSFPDDTAIKLQAGPNNPLPGDLGCRAAGARNKTFICTYSKPPAPREWKYSLRLKNSAGQDPQPLDPWVYQP